MRPHRAEQPERLNIAAGQRDYAAVMAQTEECLALAREQGKLGTVARLLNSLGNCHSQLQPRGNPEAIARAQALQQESLALAEQLGDRVAIANALRGLGDVYESLGEFELALTQHQRSLELAQELGEPELMGRALLGLGNTYAGAGDYETAIAWFRQRLQVAATLKNRLGALEALWGLANCSDALGDWQQAAGWEEQRLLLAVAAGDREHEAAARAYLGYIYLTIEQFAEARVHLVRALVLQRQLDLPKPAVTALYNLAAVHEGLGNWRLARRCGQRGLRLARQYNPEMMELYWKFLQRLPSTISGSSTLR